jgi:hypothetical protein
MKTAINVLCSIKVGEIIGQISDYQFRKDFTARIYQVSQFNLPVDESGV